MTALSADSIEQAGQAIFAFRAKSADDPDPNHRHPMIYRDYKWIHLPATEKVYYNDMAISAFLSLGFSCPNVPVYDHKGDRVAA